MAVEKSLNCYFFVPGLSERFRTGGLMVLRDVAGIFEKSLGFKTYFVATHEKHPDALTSDKTFETCAPPFTPHPSPLFIVSWGPLVSDHIKLIRKNIPDAKIIYYAQSFGWGIKIPPKIPIACVSRFVMSQWALYAPENFITYIPPPLNPVFCLPAERHGLPDPQTGKRDIDILVHTRKQNDYCLKQLLPVLKKQNLKIEIIDEWIPQPEFAKLLQRSKIFLYITELHKAGFFRRLPGEGFGLPALEALACGAVVGSNLLGGVTDFLTPGENCIKLQNGDLNFDLAQIENAIKNFRVNEGKTKQIQTHYSSASSLTRWVDLLETLGIITA
mgnify:CR=1 FL=1